MAFRHPVGSFLFFLAALIFTTAAAIGGSAPGAATPRVLFPNGGDSLLGGSDTTILWDGTAPTDTVRIEYSTDAGFSWTTITTTGTGNSHRWKVPGTMSTRCFLRITQRRPAQERWLWARVAGGLKAARMLAMAIDSAGNVIAAGTLQDSATFTGQDLTVHGDTTFSLFVAKYDRDGALLWVRRLDSPYEPSILDIATSPNGTIHFVGSFRERLTFEDGQAIGAGPAGSDVAYVASLAPDGAFTWSALAGVTGFAYGIAVARDGALYVSGTYQNAADFGNGVTLAGASRFDVFLVRFKLGGTGAASAEWARRLERRHPNLDFPAPHKVAVDAADGVYITGAFRDSLVVEGITMQGSLRTADAYLIRFRSDGTVDWRRHIALDPPLAGNDHVYPYGISFAFPDRLYIAGRFKGKVTVPSDRTVSSLAADGFLLQAGTDGALRWIRQLHDPSLAVLTSVAADAAGNAYVTGETWGGVDLGDGVRIPNAGNNDIVAASYDPSGNVLWGWVRGTAQLEYGNAIGIASDGAIRIAGQFTGKVDLGNARLQNPMATLPSSYSGFVASYDPGIGIEEEVDVSDGLWTIYGETSFELAAGRAAGMPGTRATIPISLRDGGTLRQAGIDTLHASLLFVHSLLEPIGSEPDGIIVGRESVGDSLRLRLAIPVPTEPVDTVVRLRFTVGAGDRPETLLNWGEVDAPSSASTIALRSGRFTLLGCEAGGLRLIGMRGGAKIAAAAPDPASDGVGITIETVEDGLTSLLLVDRLGKLVEEHSIDGRAGAHTLRIETAVLPSGTYTLVLRAPTDRIVRSLRIVH